MINIFNNQDSLIETLSRDRLVRQAVTKESHLMFFHVYFPHYVKYQTAEFQKDIFRITENQSNSLSCIVAFRGSGKSTLVTFSYSIWSILGVQQKKFVLIICQTQAQARQHMANLKYELEQNKLLKSDLGPFREEIGSGEWAISSLVFQNTGARVMIASIDQSIRGIRHHEHRPDLIILDDIEDINSTKTFESRNKTFDWFTREIVPLGDIGTRIMIIGNLLHEDALVMRLKKKIDNKEIRGIYKWFPLIDEDGKCIWPEKFDTMEKIDTLRQSVANESAWQQEYLLQIVSDSTRVIHPEWIQYYDELPKESERQIFIGIDLAISQRDTADYTSMVSIVTQSYGSKTKAYVLPNPINKRMTFPETVNTVAALRAEFRTKKYDEPKFIIESNGFQEIYVGALSELGCEVEGVKQMSDKRTRLALTSRLIQNGTIKFSRHGNEELIAQLTGFGVENHDDLADAFSIAILKIIWNINDNRGFESWINYMEETGKSCWV